MPNYGAVTWPHLYMPAVKSQIVSVVPGMSEDRVFRSIYEIDFHLQWPPADKFITLFQPDFPVDQTDVTGGGILNTAFDSTLLTTAFVRCEADQEGRSITQLEDESDGLYVFLEKLVTALQTYNGPVDPASGLYMFRRPMRVKPGFQVLRKSGKDGKRWAVAPVSWEVSFVSDLGVTYY